MKFFERTTDGLTVRLPRRIKDDYHGRKRGRVRRRLVVRFYKQLSFRYAAWEAAFMQRTALNELTREAQALGIYDE